MAYTKEQRAAARAQGLWCPNPGPQTLALLVAKDPTIREVLYGGARGGGKTDASIVIHGEQLAMNATQQLIIRKNAQDLRDYYNRCKKYYAVMGCGFRETPFTIRYKNSVILGGHLKDDDAYEAWQGQEFSRIGIEELTQIPTEDRYEKLIASCRSSREDVNAQVFSTANPTGAGMGWVKRRFITPDPTLCDIKKMLYDWEDDAGEKHTLHWQIVIDRATGTKRAYIPATIDDNPILMQNDPEYVKQIDSLQSTNPELYEAWRRGSWDVHFGGVFEDFKPYRHVFQKFSDYGITKQFLDGSFRVMGMDWGYNDECVCLWSMFDKITEKEDRAFIYREIHNNKQTPKWWAETLTKQQEIDPVDVWALPHDAYSHLGGSEPIKDVFKRELEKLPPDKRPRLVRADKLNQELKTYGITMLHEKFADASDGKPGLLIHWGCEYLIETLPEIVYANESGGEKIDPNCRDHALDSLLYTLLTAMKCEGKLINKADRIKTTPQGIFAGKTTYKDVGLDMGTIIRKELKRRRTR